MKAIILSAGKGSRLGELTNSIPKPMIKFFNKPILQHNIELCKKHNIKDIYINLHHLPELITEYFGDGKKFGVNIKYYFEKELLGTSGAVKNIAKDFNKDFFVIYGDNYSEYNLDLLTLNSIANIAFHYREDITNSGVAEFDTNNKILSFIEKPKTNETKSNWANAGIYHLSNQILKYIPNGFSDFSKDIFPLLLKNNIPFHGTKSNVVVKAIDTPEMLSKIIN